MVIHILNNTDAHNHDPTTPTYVIGILGIDYPSKILRISTLYKRIHNYHSNLSVGDSDDNFNSDLAKKILTDFQEGWDGCEDLLVHSYDEKTMASAVGIALNLIFRLGVPRDRAVRRFPRYRRDIFNFMMSIAREKGFIS